MKQLFNIRLFAILWVGLIAVLNCTPIKAQFDEPSRNQWMIDVSYGFLGKPSFNYVDRYGDSNLLNGYSKFSSISLTLGVNHRLFNNIYAGAHIGFKLSKYTMYSPIFRNADIDQSYGLIILPVEIGYNHTYNHKNGLNIYASAIIGYCVHYGAIDPEDKHHWKAYFDDSWHSAVNSPKICLDTAIGLRYFIKHFYIGGAYHFAIGDNQKQVEGDHIEASIGFRF